MLRCSVIVSLLLHSSVFFAQVGAKMGLSAAFAVFKNSGSYASNHSDYLPSPSIAFCALEPFHLKNIGADIAFIRDGHRFRVQNYFDEKRVNADLIKYNLGVTVFYKIAITPEHKKKKKPQKAVQLGFFDKTTLLQKTKFNGMDVTAEENVFLPWDTGLMAGYSLLYKRKKRSIAIDLRYYHGFLDTSALRYIKVYTRSLELSLSIFPKRK